MFTHHNLQKFHDTKKHLYNQPKKQSTHQNTQTNQQNIITSNHHKKSSKHKNNHSLSPTTYDNIYCHKQTHSPIHATKNKNIHKQNPNNSLRNTQLSTIYKNNNPISKNNQHNHPQKSQHNQL